MRLYRLDRVRVLAHRTERTQRDSGRGRTLQPGDDLFEVAAETCRRWLPGKPLPQSGHPPEFREYRRHDVVAPARRVLRWAAWTSEHLSNPSRAPRTPTSSPWPRRPKNWAMRRSSGLITFSR